MSPSKRAKNQKQKNESVQSSGQLELFDFNKSDNTVEIVEKEILDNTPEPVLSEIKNGSQDHKDKISDWENQEQDSDTPKQINKISLSLPDRFESLRNSPKQQIESIVIPVEDALCHLDETYSDIKASGRGAFWILRGQTGSGKSTFLNTVHLFRVGVEAYSILASDSISESLSKFRDGSEKHLSILVIEGREARKDISDESLETDLHAINGFIRSKNGNQTLVVWQCNTDDLENRLINLAKEIGGSSLLGVISPSYKFSGISKDRYQEVANRTIAVLNEGASLVSFGIAEDLAKNLVDKSETIGTYLTYIRKELLKNKNVINKLLIKERCRVWTLVIAGNEPDKDVASLTRGSASIADIDRLVVSTNANIVKELKQYPEKIGILATMLDARIIHLPILTALAIVRQFADDDLRNIMKDKQMDVDEKRQTKRSLEQSDLARAFYSRSIEPNRTKGSPIGSNTLTAFSKLMEIAKKKDEMVNKAIGESLKANGIIQDFIPEYAFKGNLDLKTDLFCINEQEPVRLEIMWRTKAGRADIAIYVLNKLRNYGKAIGYLD